MQIISINLINLFDLINILIDLVLDSLAPM